MKIIKKVLLFISVVILSLSMASCDMLSSNTTSSSEKNLYELAVEDGYTGTLNEWLLSLTTDSSYDSVYDLAKSSGIVDEDMTLEEFIASLKGEPGSSSVQEATSSALLSVVSIYCDFTYTTTAGGFFGGGRTQTTTGTSAGSGVIVEDDKENGIAYIVTNYHVVYDIDSNETISDNIYVYLYGMELDAYGMEATYIGGSMTYDIAVLKVTSDIYKTSASKPTTVSDSSEIVVGDSIIAIGNSEANGISATSGIISVKEETITMTASDNKTTVDYRVIRMDAAVNSGNSGGGLFNDSGELIGIVNAKTVQSGVEGMCYAIPTNIAYYVGKQVIDNYSGSVVTVTRPVLGVTLGIASSKAVYNEETKITSIVQNIAVNEVSVAGAAYGVLKTGDQIVSITCGDSTTFITSTYSVEDVLLRCKQNDVINLYILRDGEYQTVSVTLSNITSVS